MSNRPIKECKSKAPIIECIGDSHVCFFLGKDLVGACHPVNESVFPFFRVHTVGPALAYNLCEEGTTTGARERIMSLLEETIEPGSYVLFAFGEIDCRAHLLLQARKTGEPIERVVSVCTERYGRFIDEVAGRGFRPIIYNAPASTFRRPSWNPDVKKAFPSYGSCRERNRVTRLFNDNLKTHAAAAGYLFLENFDRVVTLRGFSRRRYFLDRIHLAQRAMPYTLRQLRVLLPQYEFPEPRGWRFKVGLSYLRMRLR